VSFRYAGDPLSVPLPNGTEITTRVDRGRIPAGAVGRVTSQEGDLYRVQVVGGAQASYARDELLPRKAGQLRWAMRRAGDWQALSGCVVLTAAVGSRAWGVEEEGSDVDERGAFVLPLGWRGGVAAPPEDLVSADGSTTYWEAGKLVRQALRADPNTLELLFVDGAEARDEMGRWLLEARDAFVSRQIYGTFGRYAVSQLKKLEQSSRLLRHRLVVLEWLREDASLTLDQLAARLAPQIQSPDSVARAKEYIKQLYRSLYDQGLISRNDLSALRELAQLFSSGKPLGTASGQAPRLAPLGSPIELPRELRPKNAYNLLRLIGSAIAWLRTGKPSLRAEGAFRDELLSVKRGEVPLEEVLRRAEARVPELDEARLTSPLRPEPDLARADALLRRILQETARRFVAGVPGPFGRDAPPLPDLEETC
jgi:predicted nucleotidyltransferase